MFQNVTETSEVASQSNFSNDSFLGQNSSEALPLLKLPIYLTVIYSFGYFAIFLFTFFGNLMVIAVVYKNERMHSATNYFIVNLAVADLLVAIFVVPFTLLDSLFTGWKFGAFMCKLTPYLQGVCVCASVTTLAAIAIDRYLAICYIFQVKITGRVCRIIIINIWVLALGVSLPWAIYHKQMVYPHSPEVFLCWAAWPNEESRNAYFLGATFLVCYAIPLLVISVCYGMIGYRVWNRNAPGISNTSGVIYKSKVKAIKMMLTVFLLFSVSWLPLYTIYLWLYFRPDTSSENNIVFEVLLPISQWLGSSNSGMNPVIYCFYSKKFRRGFKSLVTCCSSSRLQRNRSHFSTTKYMTVDYDNGHFKVSFRKEVQEDDSSSRNYV